jgi:hypothetical protein
MDALVREDPCLRHEITGKRIFYPNAVYYDEGQGSYDHGGLVSFVNPDGWVGGMNSFYDRYDAPGEVTCVREFVETVRPGLALDLHESCINARIPKELLDSGDKIGTHFLILPSVHGPTFEKVETPVAEAIVEATGRAGHECFTREHLEASWGYGETDYYHGYLRWNARGSSSFYKWVLRFAEASIVVEPRMDQPCETRVAVHTAAVRGALEKYSQLSEGGG